MIEACSSDVPTPSMAHLHLDGKCIESIRPGPDGSVKFATELTNDEMNRVFVSFQYDPEDRWSTYALFGEDGFWFD